MYMGNYNPSNIFAHSRLVSTRHVGEYSPARSFPRASLSENCSLLGTDNVRGQISEHIFAPNEGYCLFNECISEWGLSANLLGSIPGILLKQAPKKTKGGWWGNTKTNAVHHAGINSSCRLYKCHKNIVQGYFTCTYKPTPDK